MINRTIPWYHHRFGEPTRDNWRGHWHEPASFVVGIWFGTLQSAS